MRSVHCVAGAWPYFQSANGAVRETAQGNALGLAKKYLMSPEGAAKSSPMELGQRTGS
jgi:hypothetical protein